MTTNPPIVLLLALAIFSPGSASALSFRAGSKATTSKAEIFLRQQPGCHPKCAWKCADPVCDEVCQPECAAPKCETRCPKEVDTKLCTETCDDPDCAVVCPKDACAGAEPPPGNPCPQCLATCKDASCKVTCPDPQCKTVCEKPVCDWKCTDSKKCPEPVCSLDCAASEECALSPANPLPEPIDVKVISQAAAKLQVDSSR